MRVLGIDPGPKTSGVALYDGARVVQSEDALDNEVLSMMLHTHTFDAANVGIERVQFRMGHGAIIHVDVLETLWWSGRFFEAATIGDYVARRVLFTDVTKHFVGQLEEGEKKVNEAVIRRRVVAKFGGSDKVAKGTAKEPGPCFGVKGHAWSALAVAMYVRDRGSATRVLDF